MVINTVELLLKLHLQFNIVKSFKLRTTNSKKIFWRVVLAFNVIVIVFSRLIQTIDKTHLLVILVFQ